MPSPFAILRLPALAVALALASAGLGMAAHAQAAAASLAVCEGQAGEAKESKVANFTLPAETRLRITYAIAANPDGANPSALVRLQRKLPNGSFVTVKTMADLDQNGETEAKPFPAGDYKLEVSATLAIFKVSAMRD